MERNFKFERTSNMDLRRMRHLAGPAKKKVTRDQRPPLCASLVRYITMSSARFNYINDETSCARCVVLTLLKFMVCSLNVIEVYTREESNSSASFNSCVRQG